MDQPPIKGRGALILSLLKKAQENKPGEETAAAAAAAAAEPLRPKGRAALLARKLAQISHGDDPTTPRPPQEVATKSTETIQSKMQALRVRTPRLLEMEDQLPLVGVGTDKVYYYHGESGKKMAVTANYVRLKVDKDKGVFEYHVAFEPEVDNKSMRIKILNNQMQNMGKVKMFDGGALLFLPIKLPDEVTNFKCKHPVDDEDILMTVTYKKEKKCGECLQLYNVLFKKIMHALLYSPFGRNYFDPSNPVIIPQHKLEILPGYAVAVDEYEDGIMICLDTQHRVLRMQNVLELFREYQSCYKQEFKKKVNDSVVGSLVLTRYNNKTYRIDEIMWTASPKDTFETADGRVISYLEYYKKQHDLTITDVNQPLLLNHKSVRKAGSLEKVDKFICLIPELCFMTGLTDEMRSDFKVMKDVAAHTRITPNQRMNALRKYLHNVDNCETAKRILSDWGLELSSATIDLYARLLDTETIRFGRRAEFKCDSKADWNKALSNNNVFGPVDLVNWVVCHVEKDTRIARDFGENMKRLGATMGCEILQPRFYCLKNDRTNSFVSACNELIEGTVQILVFICPTMRTEVYESVKKICCAQKPIATQMIISRTLMNQQKVRQITQKIAAQITCKLGGSLWSVRFPFDNWMVCGIDAYHSKNEKSVCAFIASLDEYMTSWYSQAVFQDGEIGDHLKSCFKNALQKYRQNRGCFPKNVLIYRDGVGDGQLQHCKQYEIPQFEDCLSQFQLNDCTVTFLVVQKRINARIFLKSGSGLDNPLPGTILDNSITRRHLYDFFLVSQLVRQGTVTPTHYIVLHDSAKVKPDHVQRLTHKMCHLYYNWAGTIRVPAPCQYAHKLAYLVGQYVRKQPAQELNDKLFYL